MNNAERILRLLDGKLNQSVELTLYGRAALQLGFEHTPAEYATSLDVDVVLWVGQAEDLIQTGNFWDAVEVVNQQLAGEGLYISHFFEEHQVLLRPSWRQHRIPISGHWAALRLFRLGDADLLLSKLMRYDPQDLDDALFICSQAGFSADTVRALCAEARIPPATGIAEQFEIAKEHILRLLAEPEPPRG